VFIHNKVYTALKSNFKHIHMLSQTF